MGTRLASEASLAVTTTDASDRNATRTWDDGAALRGRQDRALGWAAAPAATASMWAIRSDTGAVAAPEGDGDTRAGASEEAASRCAMDGGDDGAACRAVGGIRTTGSEHQPAKAAPSGTTGTSRRPPARDRTRFGGGACGVDSGAGTDAAAAARSRSVVSVLMRPSLTMPQAWASTAASNGRSSGRALGESWSEAPTKRTRVQPTPPVAKDASSEAVKCFTVRDSTMRTACGPSCSKHAG
mmetsp:Transcript_4327/g.18282  ORF Transcript_4327/g.18282 Transcript_4327/m.18282 type:complete len:240 (-) Transcript_4327:957-1676(-)